mgnify:FL=1|tara:strand:+ start:1313 stop:1738 length:426 start_codon:yes stop_codon:yes gene_type:complete
MKKLLLIVALSFCFNNGYAKIIVDNEWARLTPNGMGAVYFEIKNTNNEDDFLIQASSPNAKSVMIHETQRMNNMTHMKHHTNGTKILANSSIIFEPGSFHIMLSQIDENLKLGDKILINLNFQNHDDILIEPILKIRPPIK